MLARDIEVARQRQVLVDGLDARPPGVDGLGEADGLPSSTISPSSPWWTPEMHLMSVDLPAPLSPTRPTTSPARTSRLTPLTAVRPPKRLTRSPTASIGGSTGASTSTAAAVSACPSGRRSARPATRSRAWSMSTARMTTMPMTMNCQNGSTPSMMSPVTRMAMMSDPMTVPITLPRPPNMLTPPMITAAMELSSRARPRWRSHPRSAPCRGSPPAPR